MEKPEASTKRNILRMIYTQNGVSRNEIAKTLHLSMPTVLSYIRDLQNEQLVVEEGKYASTGGRKAWILCGVPNSRFVLGCELQYKRMTLTCLDLVGNEITTRIAEIPMDTNSHYVEQVRQTVESVVEELKLDKQTILGICFAMPGPINTMNGYAELYIDGNRKFMPLNLFTASFDLPCSFLRFSDAGAYAEFRHCSANDTLMYISLNASLSGTLFWQGQIYKGEHGRGNRLGHMTLVPNGRPCYCGKKGCAVAYCSSKNLTALTADGEEETFFHPLENGDPSVSAQWNEYLNYVALLINNVHYIYDCDIVVGGRVGCAIRNRLQVVRSHIMEIDPNCHGANYVRPTHYICNIDSIGAAYSIIHDYFLTF